MKKYEKVYKKLKTQKEKAKAMPKPINYVASKKTVQELKQSIKNWKRKIEIAEVAAKKAKRAIISHERAGGGGMEM